MDRKITIVDEEKPLPETENSGTYKVARWISVAGHPFFTLPVYILVINFSIYYFKKAAFLSFLIVGCFFVPLIIWNYLKTRNGSYTNFDVSMRKQRYSMYQLAIPLLAIILVVLFLTHQSINIILNVASAVLLLSVSYLVNFFIKCSGHVSINVYLAFLILPLNFTAGILVFACSIIIGWSRIILKRHSLTEVLTGMFLGLLTGFVMLYIQGYFKFHTPFACG